ncbi:MAG: 2-C-methyl-D-erythritol 4-phosphate cytidylyltransferase [Lachnospiraceae bacterium]|jgi:2-C-methyl-D-erythritol 4-phosphate cytidylyltransferase
MSKTYAIVLAGGIGRRMRSAVPKQYLPLAGYPVIAWPLMAFEKSPEIDGIVLVTAESDADWVKNTIVDACHISKVMAFAPAGKERYDSVRNGLNAIPGEDGIVLIHDGARPAVTGEIIARCCEDARKYGACAAAMPVKDTIKVADENGFVKDTPDRRTLWMMQTPQAFRLSVIREAYEKLDRLDDKSFVTDDAMLVERFTDVKVRLTKGSYSNIKITTPEDLPQAEILVDKKLLS